VQRPIVRAIAIDGLCSHPSCRIVTLSKSAEIRAKESRTSSIKRSRVAVGSNFACEATDFAELVQRPCGVVRHIRQISKRSLAKIATREPME
jgi:hypothetical protein